MSKQYESGPSLQQKILKGVDTLANNVASTLGPKGRNVILQQKGKRPIITKDGVTVAQFVDLEDPFENVGAQILKQASEETNNNAGDGTTTATVLARAIYHNALMYLTTGASPVEIKRGMDLACRNILEKLEEQSRPIRDLEDIEHIATISANGDKVIGKLIATAFDQAGKDGAITIEEARSLDTSLDIVEGFRFDSGYVSPQFITDERRGAVKYEDSLVLVTDSKIENVEEMLPVLELVAREGRPFIIVAENIEGQALAALIMNAIRGTMRIAAVKAPRYGEERRSILKDLAISVGATFISREQNVKLREIELKHLGSASSIDITKNLTTIIDGDGDIDAIEERIEALKVELKQTENIHECEKIQERITRLASGIAIIRVGAPTEVEMIEKKHRIEDALESVKAAQEEGVVPGGGLALLRSVKDLEVEVENEEQHFGVQVVMGAAEAPIRQIADNAGFSPDIAIGKVENETGSIGMNFATGEVVDLFEAGVIDPLKVTRTALKNAVSVASTLLTADYAIIE